MQVANLVMIAVCREPGVAHKTCFWRSRASDLDTSLGVPLDLHLRPPGNYITPECKKPGEELGSRGGVGPSRSIKGSGPRRVAL